MKKMIMIDGVPLIMVPLTTCLFQVVLRGTFTWTTNKGAASDNAERFYPNSEGIDVVDGILFTTSKKLKRLMILNLRKQTYTYTSTAGGAFNEQPDQVARLVKNDPNSVLYFCEDGGKGANSPGSLRS
jgi:hypothetical protein